MRGFVKVIGALLLFAALFGAWTFLFIVVPLLGLMKSSETANPRWMIGAFAVSGLAYLLWVLAARRLTRGQTGAEWGWPWI